MTAQASTLRYGLNDKPPILTTAFLALQQIFVVAIYLTLIGFVAKAANVPPKIALSMMSLNLMAMGIITILQTFTRGPIGAGFLITNCPAVTYFTASIIAAKLGGISLVLGMTIFAGACEMLFAFLSKRLSIFFPLVVTGLTFTGLGLSVGIMALKHIMLDIHPSAYDGLAYATYLITLLSILGLSIWGKGLFRLMSLMLGLIIGCIFAYLCNIFNPTELAYIAKVPYIALPNLSYWGLAFSWNLVPLFLISAIAAGLRTFGCVMTSQEINGIDMSGNQNALRKGSLTDGLGVFLSGLIGTYPVGASPSAIGVTKAVGATSRIIGYAIAIICFIFSLSPKIAAFWISIPTMVVSAGLTVTSCIMFVGGIRLITNKPIDLRNTYIIGISLILALTPLLFPSFYQQLPSIIQTISSSMLSMIAITAIILNIVFYIGRKSTSQLIINEVNISEKAILESAAKTGVDAKLLTSASQPLHNLLTSIVEQNVNDGPIEVSFSYDQTYFDIIIKYAGVLPQLSKEENFKTDNLFEDQVYILGLSSLFKDTSPENLSIQRKNSAYILKLRFCA